jgi:hypothetical protein
VFFGQGLILRVCCITWASASEIKREDPVKSENLPGCAVQVGSVAGIIAHNVSNRAFDVKLYFTRVHTFHTTNAFKAPTIFRNNILKNQLHSITLSKKNSSLKSANSTSKQCRNLKRLAGAVERFVYGSGGSGCAGLRRLSLGVGFAWESGGVAQTNRSGVRRLWLKDFNPAIYKGQQYS